MDWTGGMKGWGAGEKGQGQVEGGPYPLLPPPVDQVLGPILHRPFGVHCPLGTQIPSSQPMLLSSLPCLYLHPHAGVRLCPHYHLWHGMPNLVLRPLILSTQVELSSFRRPEVATARGSGTCRVFSAVPQWWYSTCKPPLARFVFTCMWLGHTLDDGASTWGGPIFLTPY